MKAFASVRAEMRETCAEIGHPARADDREIARIACGSAAPADAIDPWIEVAFEGLRRASVTGEPYALVPCTMNGEPAAVIAIVQEVGSKLHVMPLFLACQSWMNFAGPGAVSADHDED